MPLDVGLGTTRAKQTVGILRERIASGEWPLNSKIPTEPELAAELGVGRSTIREAVRSLANLGMLEPARSRGTFVRSRTPVSSVLSEFVQGHDIAEVLAFRRALEVEASQLAARHRSEDDLERLRLAHASDVSNDSSLTIERGVVPGQFHALIFAAAGNTLLAELSSGIMSSLRPSLASGRVVHGADEAARHRDHAEILAAIEARDPGRAARAAAAHASHDLMVARTPVMSPISG